MTYSIVARDADTGHLGVGVQSRAFRSGGGVAWALPGVGAVATQAYADRGYGPLGLELLRARKTPDQALAGLVAADPDSEVRQVAIVAADGTVAAHTGDLCIPAAGHLTGEGFSAQGNCVDGPAVWEAAAEAFERSSGSLARRLVAALDAAEAAGGDWRGRQAAGLLVVPSEGRSWDRISDLRVDDHPQPLAELRRLLDLEEGYQAVMESSDGRAEAARAAGMDELDVRWAEIFDAAHAGDRERARSLLQPLVAADGRWADYARALGRRELLPHVEELLP